MLTLTRGVSYKKEAVDDHTASPLEGKGSESGSDGVAKMESEPVGSGE
jgi:hypothetical protein